MAFLSMIEENEVIESEAATFPRLEQEKKNPWISVIQ